MGEAERRKREREADKMSEKGIARKKKRMINKYTRENIKYCKRQENHDNG